MDKERLVRKMYKWKPLKTRTAGRPGGGCEDDEVVVPYEEQAVVGLFKVGNKF
jgi:hypothetical protein